VKITLTQDDLDTALESFKFSGTCHCLVEQAVMRELNSDWASAGYTNCTVRQEGEHDVVYRLPPEVAPYIQDFDHLLQKRVDAFTLPLPFEFDVYTHRSF
jgi:hypothetical protein